MSKKSTRLRRQELLVISAAALIISMSVFTTLWLNGFFTEESTARKNAYQNFSFTDAVVTCQQQTRLTFKGRLQSLTIDDLSSRFDLQANTYRIFFNAQVYNNQRNPNSEELFVACMVSARTGDVIRFESSEKKDAPSETIRKNDGGIFGWP